jgi:hypothetical protein
MDDVCGGELCLVEGWMEKKKEAVSSLHNMLPRNGRCMLEKIFNDMSLSQTALYPLYGALPLTRALLKSSTLYIGHRVLFGTQIFSLLRGNLLPG